MSKLIVPFPTLLRILESVYVATHRAKCAGIPFSYYDPPAQRKPDFLITQSLKGWKLP